MDDLNEMPRKIAFIGLDLEEIPRFAKWRPDVKNMMNWMICTLFSRSFIPDVHFKVAMDYLCGSMAVKYLLEVKSYGDRWDALSIEMDSILGLGAEKGDRRYKRKYFEARKILPEKRFADKKRQREYMLASCDELILMMYGDQVEKQNLIEKAERMGKMITLITQDNFTIGTCLKEPREILKMVEGIEEETRECLQR